MDPATLSICVITLLNPYLKKAAEAFAGEVGKNTATFVAEKAKGVWQRLRTAFAGHPDAEATLDRFAADPDAHAKDAEVQLRDKLASDTALSEELAAAIAEVRKAAPQLRVVQKMQEAENVIGVEAGRITRGTVDVEQDISKAKGVTGIKLGDIG